MREIEFRGKGLVGWVYGNLVYSKKENIHYIVENNGDELSFDVYSETVGQFTGFVDKNGKKIFEGDIIKYQYNYSDILQNPVVYNKGCFEVEDGSKVGFLPLSWIVEKATIVEVIVKPKEE